EKGSLVGRLELEAQAILAPEELQHTRRVVGDHGAVEPGTLAVAELEPQRGPGGALADDLGREPSGQVLGFGERAPDLLRRMRYRARKADEPLVVDLFECSFVLHQFLTQSGIVSRWRSRASRLAVHTARYGASHSSIMLSGSARTR